MTITHPDSPQAKFDAAKAAVNEIFATAKAEHREPTMPELEQANRHLDVAEELKPQIDASNRAKGLVGIAYDGGPSQPFGGHALDGDTLDYKAATARTWAVKAVEDLKTIAATRGGAESFGGGKPQGLKALLSGTINLGGLLSAPVTNPSLATSVLQLIPRILDGATSDQEDGLGSFTHLVESASTNNAATSADGTTKPTSVVTFVEKSDRYRVFANLSEAMPERYLEDYAKVTQILGVRLAEFLIDAVEKAVLIGNSATASPIDDFNGLLNTSGVQTSANAGDLLKTLTNAKLALTTLGHQPNAIVLAPADWQRYVSMRVSGSSGALLFPDGAPQIAAWLGVDAFVQSVKLTAATAGVVGTAWLGDWNQCRLRVRQDTQLKMIQPNDLAEKNQFKARLEGRFGFQVDRPAAFVKVSTDLTAIV